jgi:hypothetical protein
MLERIWPSSRVAAAIAVALVAIYGALLRLDVYTERYGTLNRPAWARLATREIAPLAARLKPSAMTWTRVGVPYAGGDPINYLKYGREMTSFYQAHVREPVFLAMTRASLAALDGQDAGVSLASTVGSLLAIAGTFLLVTAVASPLAGVAAAAVVALDYEMLSWAPEGWRDDTFTAMVAFTGWAFVRFHRRPQFGRAVLLGLLAGLACLTRITALSFVVPAFAWVALARGERPWRPRLEYVAAAAVIAAAVVLPYLLSCAIASGDPFLAINYHTTYYRAAEGLTPGHPMSVAGYLGGKFRDHPFATLDTGLTGEFVRPFTIKWTGIQPWSPVLATLLRWIALAGALALPFSAPGRLLLVILLGSLVPYAFTWNLGDGGAWRFTMHAYPLYLAAAMLAVDRAYRGVLYLRQRPPHVRRRALVFSAGVVAMGVLAAGAAFLYGMLPWYVVRESIARGESVSIATGDRDGWFYRDGWSDPHPDGLPIVRVSRKAKAVVYFPLPERSACDLVLRVDPVAPSAQQSMTVLFNSQVVLRTPLELDPQRVGAYRLQLPREWMIAGTNQLTFLTQPLVPAGSARPRFGWLDPAATIGVRLWYVRVVPLAPPQ